MADLARNIATNGAAFALTSSANTQDDPFTDGRYVVWQGRQEDSTWAVYWTDLTDPGMPIHVLSALPDIDETTLNLLAVGGLASTRRTHRLGSDTTVREKPWTGALRAVSPTTQDQLDPHVNADRVVWQDWRDVGPGEIYFQDLETGEERRITTSTAGQYKPAMDGHIIVWQDNRNGQQDLYAFDLRDGRETRLTDTPYEIFRGYGDWSSSPTMSRFEPEVSARCGMRR